jgi:hypothetical protein
MLPLARLDFDPKLVQYFKVAMDRAGLVGGLSREPRLPLTEDNEPILSHALDVLEGIPVAPESLPGCGCHAQLEDARGLHGASRSVRGQRIRDSRVLQPADHANYVRSTIPPDSSRDIRSARRSDESGSREDHREPAPDCRNFVEAAADGRSAQGQATVTSSGRAGDHGPSKTCRSACARRDRCGGDGVSTRTAAMAAAVEKVEVFRTRLRTEEGSVPSGIRQLLLRSESPVSDLRVAPHQDPQLQLA